MVCFEDTHTQFTSPLQNNQKLTGLYAMYLLTWGFMLYLIHPDCPLAILPSLPLSIHLTLLPNFFMLFCLSLLPSLSFCCRTHDIL